MSRSLKIQEFLIQLVVVYFTMSCLQKLYFRPTINWSMGIAALVLVIAALCLHLWNWRSSDKYFQPQKLSNSKELWRFFFKFLAVAVALVFLSFFKAMSFVTGLFVILWPLLLLYPVRYYFRNQWYPRALLLVALIVLSYSQFAFTKNDRLHVQLQTMRKNPQSFEPLIVSRFDKKSLTPYQANEVAWLLTTHPNEEFRDYQTAAEFAQIGLEREEHPLFAKNIADTLACAYLGQKDKAQAQQVIEKYDLSARESLLMNDELCESASRRGPASVRKKKYKYYF
jgi:hypothetical protein